MTVSPTSELDQLWRSFSPEEHSELGLLDLQRLTVERSRVAAHIAEHISEPVYGVRPSLHMWRALVHRVADGWPATDYYMVYEYLNVLAVRDGIEDYVDAMSAELGTKIRRAVAVVDDVYRAATVDDGGAELAHYCKPLADGQESRWWWMRKPRSSPPGW